MTAKRGLIFCVVLLNLSALGATCQNPATLSISPSAIENGIVGANYSEAFTAGGSADGAWSVTDGELPPGLALNSDNGNLSGTPTEAGDFTFTIGVNRFPFGGTAERAYQMTVQPELVVDFSPTVGRQGETYSYTVDVTGGVLPYTFEAVGLPAGLSMDTTTGEISGTPVEPEEVRSIQVTVTDSGNPEQMVDETAEFRVRPPSVKITTTTLDPGRVTIAYSAEVEIQDGQSPFTFAVTDGALPPGLALPDSQSTGQITGVPTEAGTFVFTISVTDSDNPTSSDSQEFTIVIAP